MRLPKTKHRKLPAVSLQASKLTMILLSLKSLRLRVVGISESKLSSFDVTSVGW